MSKVFITSDTFFGREQIIKKAKRPFETVEEMNKKLVDNWNNVVSENDTVYHLGNFAWNPIIADNILKQLNGNIIFILGEYDDALLDISEYYEGVSIIEEQIAKVKEHKAIIPTEWLSSFNIRQVLIWDRTNSMQLAPIRWFPTT